MVYGPGDKNSQFFLLYRFMKKRICPIIGDGKNIVPLVYVDDLVSASILALNKSKNGDVYLIVDENRYTLLDIIRIVKKQLRKKVLIIRIPLIFASFGALLFEGLSKVLGFTPIINRIRVDSMTKDRIFDVSKAKRHLGYNSYVSLEDGVRNSIEWYRLNNL